MVAWRQEGDANGWDRRGKMARVFVACDGVRGAGAAMGWKTGREGSP